jgi:hypothetical protein
MTARTLPRAGTTRKVQLVVPAFQQFSAAGLVAGAAHRHLVTQAQRHLAEESA